MERAANIYRKMLGRIITPVSRRNIVLYSGSEEHNEILSELFPGADAVEVQEGATLGDRMANAVLKEAVRHPDSNIILAGTDIPFLDEKILDSAAAALSEKDAVIGPTRDGGYYLIGFSIGVARDAEKVAGVFADIPGPPRTFSFCKRKS